MQFLAKGHENYRELVMRLAKTDFKLRYHGSALGYVWAILKPLLMFTILNFIFSTLFHLGGINNPYYPLELLTGLLLFNFFSEGTMTGMTSLVSKAQLVTKIYIPRWTIVLGSTMNALFVFCMNLIVLAFFFLLYHKIPTLSGIIMFLIYAILLYILIIAFSFLTAPFFVRFRDLSMIWEVLLSVLMYAAPIVYPLTMVPEKFRQIFLLNPLAFIINFSKQSLISNTFTNSWHFLVLLFSIMIVFVVSFLIFKKSEKKSSRACMKKETEQNSKTAISVKNVSKQFCIPHERINTLKGAFVNIFRKKSFENFYALKDVSFEVKKGEFFGIIGRNGSGKSTLLKILAGVYTADKGEVEVNGFISPFLELGIGFNPELSGRDNIYLNATVLGLTKKEIDKKFDSIVAFSELERFIDQKIKNYSSGMSVRLAFSVAIHANREILLMDEVLAVGDANFQTKCLNEFNKYKETGKTVVLVTHDIDTVKKYCDRAMLLRDGKIEMIGNPEEVGNRYVYQNSLDEEKRIKNEKIS